MASTWKVARSMTSCTAALRLGCICDEQFVETLHWRLGIGELGVVPKCKNFAAKRQEECGHTRDQHGDHSVCCAFGPWRIKRHDDVSDSIADMIDETGAHVRREAFISAFSTEAHEAWLDIWAFAGHSIQDLLVDVTIRHPMSSAYQPDASRTAGSTAAAAEEQKQKRYPPSAGRQVRPFAMEAWGRLGADAEELLQTLAAEATLHARRRGHAATASTFLRRWRATLDAVLHKGIANSLLASRTGLAGRPHSRRRWSSDP
eukprot:TRINITY_DN14119_c0_g3_i1.p1 TRINITY_DN14119_c0_g3~~TRINITY_DN14119_c0_g3_i1.p1  ORF type:complete len:260 (+),score=27.98 TRINITY_DN14119_c0_g3_i1:2-781(+)